MSVFEKYGCVSVINASGKMTALGGSVVHDDVAEAMRAAAKDYVQIAQLMERAGQVIARATGAEDGCPSTGAASGIVLAVAAAIVGTDLSRIEALPDTDGVPNEVVILKGHAINFGSSLTQLIRIAGGRPVEVGQVNHAEAAHITGAIGERTAAVLYVVSHHAVQKGMPALDAAIAAAKEAHVPLIVDAAAESDLQRYIALGADAVCYSGGKALGGPTSGFVCGTRALMQACRAQYSGVGRPMKVGKETIAGLCAALERYGSGAADNGRQQRQLDALLRALDGVSGVRGTLVPDETGRPIIRALLQVDPTLSGVTARELSTRLQQGDPGIFTRDYEADEGFLSIDPRPLREGQELVVAQRIAEIVAAGREG